MNALYLCAVVVFNECGSGQFTHFIPFHILLKYGNRKTKRIGSFEEKESYKPKKVCI